MKIRFLLPALIAILATPAAHADWLEVFHMELNDDCTAPELQGVGDKLTKKFGADVYSVEILTNGHGATNTSVLWIGRSPNAATWGKANDNWAAEIASGGQAAQLNAEIGGCASTVTSGSWRGVR
jgi:hypothetical protein